MVAVPAGSPCSARPASSRGSQAVSCLHTGPPRSLRASCAAHLGPQPCHRKSALLFPLCKKRGCAGSCFCCYSHLARGLEMWAAAAVGHWCHDTCSAQLSAQVLLLPGGLTSPRLHHKLSICSCLGFKGFVLWRGLVHSTAHSTLHRPVLTSSFHTHGLGVGAQWLARTPHRSARLGLCCSQGKPECGSWLLAWPGPAAVDVWGREPVDGMASLCFQI